MLIRTEIGDFHVEEACAGLRFLIASVVTGTLMAHLFFTRWKKQALVVLAFCVVPVLANVIRAALTVLVASWTNMEFATGIDHLFYGWVFFAVVMAVLVVGCLRFADP